MKSWLKNTRLVWMQRPRWLRGVITGVLVAWLGYVVLGNLFLNTPLGPWAVNRKPERFHVEWQWGVTWWPGVATLHGARLNGHVGGVLWNLQAESASGRVALLPLLRKELRVPSLAVHEVAGAVDRAGTRLEPAPARPGGWVLRLDSVKTDSFTGGRAGPMSLKGRGNVEIGIYKQLRGGPLELTPSRLHLEEVDVRMGDQSLLDDGVIDVDFSIARHTRAEAPGLQKLGLTDARVTLDGNTGALRVDTDPSRRIVLRPAAGHGRAHASLAISRGALLPGGVLRWQMPVTVGKQHPPGSLEIKLDVDDDVHVTALLPSQEAGDLAIDADMRVSGTQLPQPGLDVLLPRVSGHVIGSWQFDSLDWLEELFPRMTWLSLEGAGRVDADVQIAEGQVQAGSHVDVPEIDVVARIVDNRISGSARARVQLDVGDEGQLLPRMDLKMDAFGIASLEAGGPSYVEGNDLSMTLTTTQGLQRGVLRQQGGIGTVRDALRAHVIFNDAKVPDLRAYNRYLPSSQLRFDGGAGRVSGDLALNGAGVIETGSLRVRANAARLHTAGLDLRGNIDVQTRLHDSDLRGRRFDISGTTLALTDISFSEPGGDSSRGWWARIHLRDSQLEWDKTIHVDGHADITMKDVGFVLSLFARKRDYPKWIFKLVDAGQAEVTGQVQLQGDTLVLDKLQARNNRFDFAARLKLKDKSRVGSLFAKWGILSVGVQVNDGQRQFHLRRSREWYDAQPDLIR